MAKQTVLIVDDIPFIAQSMEETLQEKGYKVFTASGGAEALNLATRYKPDVILLDIVMPDISGYEVLEEIKKRAVPTRIIMCTAHFRTISDVIWYIKAGACDYLLKPVSSEDLCNAVKRALALESTITLVTSNPTPLVNKLMIETEQLEQDNYALECQVQQLKTKNVWLNFTIRMIYLLAASVVTIVFYQLQILTNTLSLFYLPLIIFVLLLFPIERVKIFFAKHYETEAKVEVESNKEEWD